ncbi:MAG TPA: redoxin domain-containing protein [Flavobacterium lutivivi]|nr:redoxin domain-containing protein [Flavobacterium lutivivi]
MKKMILISIYFLSLFGCNAVSKVDVKSLKEKDKEISILNKEIPEFKFFDIKHDMFSSSNTLNKIVLFYYCSVKSEETIKEIQNLKLIQEKYKNRTDIEFVMLTKETPEELAQFHKKYKLNFSLVPNQYDFVPKYFHIKETSTFIVKKQRKVTMISKNFAEVFSEINKLAIN